MKKSKKIKYITGLSVLGIISSAAPILGTGFSNKKTSSSLNTSNADTNISTLNWFKRKQYSQSTSSGIQQCIKNDNLQLFNDFPALNNLTFTIDVTTTAGKANITLDASSGVSGFTGSVNWIAKCAKPDPGPTPTPSQYIQKTYGELKNMVIANQLEVNSLYEITDYEPSLSSAYTSTVTTTNHKFNLVIRAISTDSFSETAIVTYNDTDKNTDHYFYRSETDKNNLSVWEVKYCFQNNTDRFDWATSSGKGVIYHMKDEFGNEAGYDFKNLKFIPYDATTTRTDYRYTFDNNDATHTNSIDTSINGKVNLVNDNVIQTYIVGQTQKLNNIVFLGTKNNNNIVKNNCHDIVFKANETSVGNNTNNSLGYNCNFNDISAGFKNNTIADSFTNNTLGYNLCYNTFNNNCNNNKILNTDSAATRISTNLFDFGTSYILVDDGINFNNNKIISTSGTVATPFEFVDTMNNAIIVNGKTVPQDYYSISNVIWDNDPTVSSNSTSNPLVLKVGRIETQCDWQIGGNTSLNLRAKLLNENNQHKLRISPTEPGLWELEIQAVMNNIVMANKIITISVTGDGILGPTVINMHYNESTRSIPYSVSGVDNPTWSVVEQGQGTAPTGVSINSSTGMLKIDAQSNWNAPIDLTIKAETTEKKPRISVKLVPTGLNKIVCYTDDPSSGKTETIYLGDDISLSDFTFNERNPGFYNVPAYGTEFTRTISPTVTKEVTLVSISPLFTKVPDEFFSGFSEITSFNLVGLSSIRYIGNNFLKGCTSLSYIDLFPLIDIIQIGYGFLQNCDSLATIQGHVWSIDAYYANDPLTYSVSKTNCAGYGRTVTGTTAEAVKAAFPNSSTEPYRKWS